MTDRENELHEHYARNAVARGHAATCALVTTPRNWPTILGRPSCTCTPRPRPSIERATDRLAHDVSRIYDVLP